MKTWAQFLDAAKDVAVELKKNGTEDIVKTALCSAVLDGTLIRISEDYFVDKHKELRNKILSIPEGECISLPIPSQMPFKKQIMMIEGELNRNLCACSTEVYLPEFQSVAYITSFIQEKDEQEIIMEDTYVVIMNGQAICMATKDHKRVPISIIAALFMSIIYDMTSMGSVAIDKHEVPARRVRKEERAWRLRYYVRAIKPSSRRERAGAVSESDRKRVSFHVRRGHWRHFKDGSMTWINQCNVGSATVGIVEKTYVMDGSK